MIYPRRYDAGEDLDELLDRRFPLGDGTAQTTATVQCPYCWQSAGIVLDPGSGARQEYIEDCPVCCQPWRVRVRYDADGTASVMLEVTGGA